MSESAGSALVLDVLQGGDGSSVQVESERESLLTLSHDYVRGNNTDENVLQEANYLIQKLSKRVSKTQLPDLCQRVGEVAMKLKYHNNRYKEDLLFSMLDVAADASEERVSALREILQEVADDTEEYIYTSSLRVMTTYVIERIGEGRVKEVAKALGTSSSNYRRWMKGGGANYQNQSAVKGLVQVCRNLEKRGYDEAKTWDFLNTARPAFRVRGSEEDLSPLQLLQKSSHYSRGRDLERGMNKWSEAQ